MSSEKPNDIILKGIAGSPGIAIGKAYLVERGNVDIVDKYYIAKERVQAEVERFKDAVAKSKKDLLKIIIYNNYISCF